MLSGTAGRNATINNNTIGGTAAGSITDNVVGSYAMYAIRVTAAQHDRHWKRYPQHDRAIPMAQRSL